MHTHTYNYTHMCVYICICIHTHNIYIYILCACLIRCTCYIMLPDGRIPETELQARSLRERGDLEKVGGLVSDHWNHWAVIITPSFGWTPRIF